MADSLSEILNGASGPDLSSATPASPGSGGEDLTKILHGETDPNQPAPAEPLKISGGISRFLQTGEETSLSQTVGLGLARGWGQTKAIIPSLQAMHKEYSGDLPGAIDLAQKTKTELDSYGDSDWNLQNIHSPGDFGNWVAEKLGEQGVNLLTMGVTGGVGGFAGKTLAETALQRGLMSQTAARALMLAGKNTPNEIVAGRAGLAGAAALTYPATTAMETAGTSQEQFETSQAQNKLDPSIPVSTQPGRSLAAGAAKGVLELLAPLDVGRALLLPGKQLGKSTLGGIGRLTLDEGLTEGAQEAIDIYARKLQEPGYSYFKDGPTIMPSGWGEGMWRLAESTAAGGVVGGIVGAPFAHREQRIENQREVGSEAPGTRTVIPPDVVPHTGEPAKSTLESYRPGEDSQGLASVGPVTALRQMSLRGSQDRILSDSISNDPRGDFLSIGPLLADLRLGEAQKERMLDALDASTPRFIDQTVDSSRLFTDTELERHDALNRVAAEKPQWVRVDQRFLQPAAITAHLEDLPPANSERIYFLPETTPEQKAQALASYPVALTGDQNAYDIATTNGLRVIPSRGAGFHYNGVLSLKGLPIEDIKATKRSDEVAWYDPASKRIVTPFTGNEEEVTRNAPPGGILIAFDKNRISKENYIEHENGDIELKQPWDGGLTVGITPGFSQILKMGASRTNFKEQEDKTTVRVVNDVLPENTELTIKLAGMARELAPAVDRILKAVGIEKPVGIYFTDQDFNGIPSPAWAFPDEGAIVIVPKHFKDYMQYTGQTAEIAIQDTIMHELGHLVTFNYWRNLPTEHQSAISYAWGKAQLATNMGDLSRTSMPGMVDPVNVAHWQTLSEFLAEQFRRWTISDVVPRTEVERTFKAGARQLENYYREWEKKTGRDQVMNFTHPDYYFSATMEYLKAFTQEREGVRQAVQRRNLQLAPQDLLDSPILTGIANTVISATESMNPMIPKDLQIQLKQYVNPGINSEILVESAPGVYNKAQGKNLDFIEIGLAALPNTEELLGGASRVTLAHELVHAYEARGYFTPEELRLLTNEGLANASKFLEAGAVQSYRTQYRTEFEQRKANGEPHIDVEASVKYALEQEIRAHYVAYYANSGVAFGEQSRGIMARLMAFIERIRNYLNNLGYQTKEDLLRAIFKGEMIHRADRIAENAKTQDWISGVQRQASISETGGEVPPSAQWQKGDMTVQAYYEGFAELSKKESHAVIYHWKDKRGNQVGELLLQNRGPKGFEVAWVETAKAAGMVDILRGSTLQKEMIQEAERDLGVKFRAPSYFTEAGFKMASTLGVKLGLVDKDLMSLYTKISINNGENVAYVTPNYLRERVQHWGNEVANTVGEPESQAHEYAIEQFKAFRGYVRALPKDIWSDPRLEKMFNLKRNWERDEVQGSLLRSGQRADEAKLMGSLGFPQGKTSEAFGDNLVLKQQLSQGENARVSGLPFELSAPSSMYSFHLGKTWSWASGMEGAPWKASDLKNLRHEADRIGKFTKNWISIKQLAQANEKDNIPLQSYVSHLELAQLLGSKWHQVAKETLHQWDNGRNAARQQSLIDVFFGLNDMQYRTPAEIQAKVQRLPGGPGEWQAFLQGQPATGELFQFFKSKNLLAKDWDIVRRVHNDFGNFLTEAEGLIAKKLQSKLAGSPTVLAQALAKLQGDMAKFRTKPYFPMMRFGQFTLAMRDGGKLVEVHAFGTQRERDAARSDLRKKYPTGELTIGTVPEHAIEFMGLPAPLLTQIKENLLDDTKPGLTPEQITLMQNQKEWIAEFELLHDPDRSFRKRWLPAKGTPGYSLDAKRVYAHYFNSGARYLSRLAYLEELRKDINDVRALANTRGDQTKITKIGDYMESHLNYYLEGGRDGGKFRAFVALWFLGFSPIAAAMNYTQPILNGIPKLGADFNSAKAAFAWTKANAALAKNMGYATGNPQFEKARQEMIRQEYIDVGQGAELASFAEANNLSKLRLGTKAQQFYRKLGNLGMWMFQGTEHYAREVMMHTAWHLAMENPQAKRLGQLDVLRLEEVADLMSRLQMSHQEALAFVYAKEAIDRTQFSYNRMSDPPVMRGAGKNFLIFFKFTQSTLFAFGHNGAFIQMMLMYLFFYGISGGIPGSDDANEFIRWLSKIAVKMGFASQEVDLQDSARAAVRGLTKGTIFDEIGPDLAMHGISRYGMGMGLLPGGWGVLGGFDASANGSIGKVIPGFADAMHGLNNGKDTSKSIADGVERAAGAGYGTVFAMLHALNDPGSADSKKWTAFVPRAFKGMYSAYRYGAADMLGIPTDTPKAATNSMGAKIPGTHFDTTDWYDMATVFEQALGATPRKVSQQWEALRAITDVEETFKARRSALMVQLDKTLLENNVPAREDVLAKIRKYDDEVSQSFPQFVIKGDQLASSLRQRQKQRGMMEALGIKNKGEFGTSQKIMEDYPAAAAARVEKVK